MQNVFSQLVLFQQLQVKTTTAISQVLADSLQELTRLNLAMGQKAVQDSVGQLNAWANARTPEQVVALMEAQNTHLVGYANELKGALVKARETLSDTVEAHLADMQELTATLFDDVQAVGMPGAREAAQSLGQVMASVQASVSQTKEASQAVEACITETTAAAMTIVQPGSRSKKLGQ
jgi:hypothetical protein